MVGATGIEPVTPSMSRAMFGWIFDHLRQQTMTDNCLKLFKTTGAPCQLLASRMFRPFTHRDPSNRAAQSLREPALNRFVED